VANEDHNLYSFDMRQLDKARTIHRGHVRAVLSLDYSPTGREIVSGSYDRTVRVFRLRQAALARRLPHVRACSACSAVQFTGDAHYLLTGSDDANVRVWKSDAAAPLRVVGGRERRALVLPQQLCGAAYAHMPEIRKIERFQHLPKSITIPAKEEVIVRASPPSASSTIGSRTAIRSREETQARQEAHGASESGQCSARMNWELDFFLCVFVSLYCFGSERERIGFRQLRLSPPPSPDAAAHCCIAQYRRSSPSPPAGLIICGVRSRCRQMAGERAEAANGLLAAIGVTRAESLVIRIR
jgi:hypothetical protein